VDQAEEQVQLEVLAYFIQLQQEQAYQVKVIQVVLITTHPLNMVALQGAAVLVQQAAMVMQLALLLHL
jgi:hypothetical protein